MSVVIRDANLDRDRPAFERFIHGTNTFEAQFEPDRRLDPEVGADYLAELLKRIEKKHGRIFVAEVDAVQIGWAVCYSSDHYLFVREEERPFGYVAELFVDEAHRGLHIGRSLLKSCEDHFRALGFKSMLIGALARNGRAVAAYRAAGFRDYAIEFSKRLE